MNKRIKNFIKSAKREHLSDSERDVLRSRIAEFISFNPIRGALPRLSERNSISIFEIRAFAKAAAFILVITVVAGGTGVSAAAKNSLPGETLYGIKVNVNEAIEEGFARSPEARVAVQSKNVERRLEEVQSLAKSNKLSTENQKIVIEKIEEHIKELEEGIDALREEGEVELVLETTAKLAPAMEAHKEILEKSAATLDSTESDNTDNLIAKVEDGIKAVENEENETIAVVSNEPDPTLAFAVTMAKAVDLEKEFKKDAREQIDEIESDIEDLVKSRIDSARDKIRLIEEQHVILETKLTPTAVEEPEPTTQSKADAIAASIVPTTISVTDDFNIDSRLKLANDLLREATRLANEAEWREALSLAQEVNRIAAEIETHIHLKELDLAQAATTENEASVIKSTN